MRNTTGTRQRKFIANDKDAMGKWSKNNTLDPAKVSHASEKIALWTCNKYGYHHEHQMPIVKKVRYGQGCPYCSGHRVLAGFNDLKTTHPDIASQWSVKNDKRAYEVSRGHKSKVWWLCDNGHEWQDKPKDRTMRGTIECPFCSGRKALTGYNDLATLNPELMTEWSKENKIDPSTIRPGNDYRASWICKNGHQWKTVVKERATGHKSGCPQCWATSRRSGMEIELYNWVKSLLNG